VWQLGTDCHKFAVAIGDFKKCVNDRGVCLRPINAVGGFPDRSISCDSDSGSNTTRNSKQVSASEFGTQALPMIDGSRRINIQENALGLKDYDRFTRTITNC
jgi:hypothetical protein